MDKAHIPLDLASSEVMEPPETAAARVVSGTRLYPATIEMVEMSSPWDSDMSSLATGWGSLIGPGIM